MKGNYQLFAHSTLKSLVSSKSMREEPWNPPPPKKNHWLKPILSSCLPHIVLSPLHISFYLRRMFVLYLKTLQANDIHKLLQDSTYTDAFTTLFCFKIKYNVPPMLFVHRRCYSWSAILGITQRLTWWHRISRSSSAPMIRVFGVPAACPMTSTWRLWRSQGKTPIYDCWKSWR